MPITHHPPDDTVLRYANGTLPEAPAIAVATHLSFCPPCRHRMETYEMLGGSMLESVPPASLSPDALSTVLARLDTTTLTPSPSPSRAPRHHPALPSGLTWPEALGPYDIPEWRSILPGVKWTAPSFTSPGAGQL